jgi:hypothetical protein
VAALSLVVACSSEKKDRSRTSPAPAAAPSPKPVLRIDGPFPIVEGTRYTFRGQFGDEVLDTWETKLAVIDRATGLLQYLPHNDVATVFTKAGFQVDRRGISIPATASTVSRSVLASVPDRARRRRARGASMFPATYTVVAQSRSRSLPGRSTPGASRSRTRSTNRRRCGSRPAPAS